VRGVAAVLGDDLLRPLERGFLGVARSSLEGVRADAGGLSSSAAITIACISAMRLVNDVLPESSRDAQWHTARVARRVENEHVGVRCGILDQASIVFSERDCLTFVDCAKETRAIANFGGGESVASDDENETPRRSNPCAASFRVLLAFSGLRKALTSTGYNSRVEECREAARWLLRGEGGRAETDADVLLGDVPEETYRRSLVSDAETLPEHLARRAAHFFGEVARVERGERAWRAGDLKTFGELMNASGASSVENYECGCVPMNDLCEIVRNTPGVYGARFSGAGFRGCVMGLVETSRAETAARTVAEAYGKKHPEFFSDDEKPNVVLADTARGARMV
jgi:galactokinase